MISLTMLLSVKEGIRITGITVCHWSQSAIMNGIECTLYTLIDIISNFGSRFDNLANNYILIWGGG